jgi:hypothetical protein
LASQLHASGIRAVPAPRLGFILPGVPLAGERLHLVLEHLAHVHQAQGYQAQDQLHAGVQIHPVELVTTNHHGSLQPTGLPLASSNPS